MKRMFSSISLMMGLVVYAQAAKNPSDYFAGQLGAVDPDIVEALKKDIPMARRVLTECALSKVALERRSCASMALEIENNALAEYLHIYLKDNDADVRREAAQSFSRLIGAEAIQWISPLVDDPVKFNRISVMGELMSVGGVREDVRAHIRRKMANDPDPEVRLSAAKLLASRGEPVSREIALSFIDSSTVAVRNKAISLLGYVGVEADIALLDGISQKRGFGKGYAMEAAWLLRLKFAGSTADRRQVMNRWLQVDSRWAAIEMVRRYRLGEKEMLDIAEQIAKDETHPGHYDAKGALEIMKKHR